MAETVSRKEGSVVVNRAEQATRITLLFSLMASTNRSAGTSTPRSTMSKPELSSIMTTRFLPMSCKSPATVPMIQVPNEEEESPAMIGFKTSTPFDMALAAINISGTKISPLENLSPTTPMDSIIASKISWALAPESRAS